MGAQRLQMALQYGPDAPGHVLDGWQRESGREATDVPYWDAVAGVTTPTEIDRLPGFDDRGRPLSDLDAVHQRALQSVPHGRPRRRPFYRHRTGVPGSVIAGGWC
jgi:hypothetical protein